MKTHLYIIAAESGPDKKDKVKWPCNVLPLYIAPEDQKKGKDYSALVGYAATLYKERFEK